MISQTYTLFDGTVLDLSAITGIGPIDWTEDSARPGSCGEFWITESGLRPRRLTFGVSSLVGPFRFMEAVRVFTESGEAGCPANQAYASLSGEARRMLEIRHADIVAAWQSLPAIAKAA